MRDIRTIVLSRRHVLARATAAALVLALPRAFAASDPLPSWNDGQTKAAVIAFVDAVTTEGGADYVAPVDRIAVFDNDGTLWVEQPVYTQLAFALDRVKVLAPQHPEWKTKQPFKAVLENDLAALAETGTEGIVQLVMATHAGMTTEEFAGIVTDWLVSARHPRFQRPYIDLDLSADAGIARIPGGRTASRPTSCPAAASSSCAH